MTEAGEPERLVAATVERFSRVDVLVNNVGGTAIRRLEELTDADWQASFDLNLMTAIRATRAAVPVMREHGSAIVERFVDARASARQRRCQVLRNEGWAAVLLAPGRRFLRRPPGSGATR